MKSFIALFAVCLMASSCTKEKVSIESEKTYSYTDEQYYEDLDPVFVELGGVMGKFFDEMVKDGTDTFFARNEIFSEEIRKPLSLEALKELYVSIHKMDELVVNNYFDMLVNREAFILNEANKKGLMDGIFFYAFETNKDLHLRWIFRTIANILDAPCSLKVVAGVFDTAVLGAIAVATAPTGVLAGVAIGGIASSYVDTINTAQNCN